MITLWTHMEGVVTLHDQTRKFPYVSIHKCGHMDVHWVIPGGCCLCNKWGHICEVCINA